MIFKKACSIPFIIWIAIGTIIPISTITYYGFTNFDGNFTLGNVLGAFTREHLKAIGLSLLLASISTLICLLLAFPLAMILRNSKRGKEGILIFVFVLPMWMNFLLRTMAWQVLLEKEGVINSILQHFNLPTQHIINTPYAIVFGMVYDFLPFMILPIYNAISKIDKHIIEAAFDMGAHKAYVYRKIILPLSIPGIISGTIMVFIPGLTTFVISNMLGGGKVDLIGNIIEQEFTVGYNWHLGSGLSFVIMIFIIISMLILNKFSSDSEETYI